MSYIALARKWRPRTFSQLVGQDHITQALTKSLNKQRIHHAYLFTGTRGVGKTSVARLLAKALNCEQGMSAQPCLSCDTCVAIEKGCFVDLIEVDGASRTRVEDTRDLLENVHYAPTSGRFKIYLIDEVHMLSQHSFNALLKTLEEPPAHVKFLLATTDPQKLPVTVLSRCLQFNLRHLHDDVIRTQLKLILHDEQLTYDQGALDILAKAAKGSMRDALSLLDQAIARCDTELTESLVKDILGYTQQDYALQLLQALSEQSPGKIIHISREIAKDGGYFQYTLSEMLNYLHQIGVSQHIDGVNPLISSSPEILALSTQFSKEDIQLFYQIGIQGSEDMHLAPTLAIGFEMTMLRMFTFQPEQCDSNPKLVHQRMFESNESPQPIPHPQHSNGSVDHSALPISEIPGSHQVDITLPNVGEQLPIAEEVSVSTPQAPCADTWVAILSKLKLTGLALNAIEQAEWIEKTDCDIYLRVAAGHVSLFTPTVIRRIEDQLSQYYAEKIKITLKSESETQSTPAQQKEISRVHQQQEAASALQNDTFFQQLRQEFSAELVKNSIASL